MMRDNYENFRVLLAFFAIFIITTNNITFAHREHKVHNIVLYPDKHSWCKTLAIKQVISYPGCKSEEIDNNVCVGTCFSYSIPHTEPSDPGEVIVPYCDSCQPSDTTWHHVTLECTKNLIDTPPQLVKRVQIINNCSCTSCEKSLLSQIHPANQFIDEDDNDLIMSHVYHDVPDVLKILNRNNETQTPIDDGNGNDDDDDGGGGGDAGGGGAGDGGTSSSSSSSIGSNNLNTSNIEKFKDIKQIVNHKIITLLKNIQENNSIHDKEQLMDLLRMIQGPNSKLNDKNIEDFVNSLHSENIELDIPRLREILIKFEHSKYYEKHRKYFNKTHERHENENNDNDNNNDDNNNNNHHHHHYEESIPSASSIENDHHQKITSSVINENLRSHENENHHENGVHGSTGTDVGGGSGGGGIIKHSQSSHHQQHHSSHHSHHHHHHIGENIIGHGHLTRGPHGALVIEPGDNEHHHIVGDDDDDDNDHNSNHAHHEQHEKLDVNPHELKPNHAGTLLSYSGHSVENSRKP